jgi:hypothetical protein
MGALACRRFLVRIVIVAHTMAKPPKIHDDTIDSLLDRVGIIREEISSATTVFKTPPISRRILTTVAHKPSIVIEQVSSSYSVRFPELSQPI